MREGDSVADIRLRVERALGLARPLPMAALQRMMDDEEYFHHLIAARTAPAMLSHLIAFAEGDAKPSTSTPIRTGDDEPHSAGALVAKAAKAFASWSKGGFTQVDEAVRERRLTACLSCEKLSASPKGLLYKVAGLIAADNRTCSACGCMVTAKARLPYENCPLPAEPGSDISRWGEPLRRKK
ncbi:hypothetical protein SSBR45R_45610 [Bradyrhizobium sp. SSBR45R]|nr:hypothetical protein SSBR45R_45610 [Bradyrhizobium sp. SSBR45R]